MAGFSHPSVVGDGGGIVGEGGEQAHVSLFSPPPPSANALSSSGVFLYPSSQAERRGCFSSSSPPVSSSYYSSSLDRRSLHSSSLSSCRRRRSPELEEEIDSHTAPDTLPSFFSSHSLSIHSGASSSSFVSSSLSSGLRPSALTTTSATSAGTELSSSSSPLFQHPHHIAKSHASHIASSSVVSRSSPPSLCHPERDQSFSTSVIGGYGRNDGSSCIRSVSTPESLSSCSDSHSPRGTSKHRGIKRFCLSPSSYSSSSSSSSSSHSCPCPPLSFTSSQPSSSSSNAVPTGLSNCLYCSSHSSPSSTSFHGSILPASHPTASHTSAGGGRQATLRSCLDTQPNEVDMVSEDRREGGGEGRESHPFLSVHEESTTASSLIPSSSPSIEGVRSEVAGQTNPSSSFTNGSDPYSHSSSFSSSSSTFFSSSPSRIEETEVHCMRQHPIRNDRGPALASSLRREEIHPSHLHTSAALPSSSSFLSSSSSSSSSHSSSLTGAQIEFKRRLQEKLEQEMRVYRHQLRQVEFPHTLGTSSSSSSATSTGGRGS